jgi:hypothetical protein
MEMTDIETFLDPEIDADRLRPDPEVDELPVALTPWPS